MLKRASSSCSCSWPPGMKRRLCGQSSSAKFARGQVLLFLLGQAMEKHNVGIVGLGWPGERHAEGVQECGLGHLYAACDLSEERRLKFAAKYSPEKVFGNYDEMLWMAVLRRSLSVYRIPC